MRVSLYSSIFLVLFSACFGAVNAAARPTSKHKHKTAAVHVSKPEGPILDSTSEAAWRKKTAWLYRDSALSLYREALIRPLAVENHLGPGSMSRRGGFVEMAFPRGRPLHEYAYQVESRCVQAGFRILEGREFDPPEEKIEYHLITASGDTLALRLTVGKGIIPGAARMAIIVVTLDSVSDADAKKLLASRLPLTLAVPVDSDGVAARWKNLPFDKKALLELPMEPSKYPYVRPGPGALFIHHSEKEIEKLLVERVKLYPEARGFATTFGDRAIENRPLVTSVFKFAREKSLLFFDLTASSRSLTNSVALQTAAEAYTVRIQEPNDEVKVESELLRRCDLAGRTGEGVWVLRYSPQLTDLLEKLLAKNQAHFAELGLQWVTVDGLHRSPAAQ